MFSCLTLGVALAMPQANAKAAEPAAKAAPDAPVASDVVARVGDQKITFAEINSLINSSGVIGVAIPAVGTPQRDTARIVVLDKLISANLTYLDALRHGMDKDPRYVRDMARFERAILAGLYRRREMVGKIPVSEEEVQEYLKKNVVPGTELTADVRLAIESKIRRQKLKERLAQARGELRKGVQVVVYNENLDASGDAGRADSTPVAEMDGQRITWGEVKGPVVAAGKGAVKSDPLAMEDEARSAALEREIDLRLMTEKAKAAGLDKDPVYKARVDEYRKTHLINLYREGLIASMEPSKDELKSYYEANKARFVQPETRKIQMVVVKTKAEAEQLKAKIQAGDMTMYQAAQKHSIAAGAKQNLGEVGWVNKGDTVPALDKMIFALGPGEVGGPVETPAGWHLVTVQDVQEAKYDSFDDEVTQKLARREYLNGKLNAYAADLRKNAFPVEVYQDVLVRLSQREADAVAKLMEKAKQPGSVTEKRAKELQKLMKP